MLVEIAICSLVASLLADRLREGGAPDTAKKIAFLRRAARRLHALDEEHFEGGCGDNAVVLKLLADAVRMAGVEIKAGAADGGEGRGPHAWLLVDGQLYDPTWDVLRIRGRDYVEDLGILDLLYSLDGVSDDALQETVETLVRSLAPKRELMARARGRARETIKAEEGPDPTQLRLVTGLDLERERERDRLFDALADSQRGAPERAMNRIQHHLLGAGLYGFVAEHTGDLIHRMSEHPEWLHGNFGAVAEKVRKVLRALTSDYGFERDVREQLASNYRYVAEHHPEELRGRSFEEVMSEFMDLCRRYANEHRKLTPYNRVQRAARRAAIAIGEWRFGDAKLDLWLLEDVLERGPEAWRRAAMEHDG